MVVPKVYVDTNILKFSATDLIRFKPRVEKFSWDGVDTEVVVHDRIRVNPNDNIQDPILRKEADLLPRLADLAKGGSIRFLIQAETMLESFGIPDMDSRTGRFYGAPMEHIESPVRHSRIMGGLPTPPKDLQFEFLSNLQHERFIDLQKMTGAYQGERMPNRNQLLDAFHLWCAEDACCDYFLTMDFKLIRHLSRSASKRKLKVKPVRPSELLQACDNDT